MIKHSITGFMLGTFLMLPMAASSATFSIVVMTDSQFYAERHPEILEEQIDWIVANQVAENIIYVAQTGDLKDDQFCDDKTVNVGTGAGRTEWQIVDDAYTDMDTANIPYAVLPGNHDFDPVSGFCPSGAGVRPLTQYDARFGPARFAGDPFYGDPLAVTPGNRISGSNEDNFTLFDSNGVEFIAINLAYRPAPGAIGLGNPELAWADNLLKTYPDRVGIVTSHYFLNTNDGTQALIGPYGQEVYDTLSNNRNLFMMLSGHWYGEGWSSETAGRAGFQPTQILMANYQGYVFPDDGDPTTPVNTPNAALIDFGNLTSFRAGAGATDAGFMRIMRFDTQTGDVDIETFIPPVVPVKNRTGTIVSTNTVTSGASMDEFTASNLNVSYLGYASLPNGFDIFECDTPTGGTCADLIGSIAFPSSSGSQTSGSGIRLTYTCNGIFCDGDGYDEGDIQNVNWTINGSGDLTALEMQLNTDPNCLSLGSPLPCSQSTVNFTFSATNLTENTASGGSCDDPGTGPQCISGIGINGANQFDPH